jgi:hypothetical protein
MGGGRIGHSNRLAQCTMTVAPGANFSQLETASVDQDNPDLSLESLFRPIRGGLPSASTIAALAAQHPPSYRTRAAMLQLSLEPRGSGALLMTAPSLDRSAYRVAALSAPGFATP